jgi:hypothetical protein
MAVDPFGKEYIIETEGLIVLTVLAARFVTHGESSERPVPVPHI